MERSKVLKKLKEGKPVLCTKTNFNEPSIVEQIGLMGFDCIWICREHLWSNDETLANMIRAARGTGMDALVRIERENFCSAIKPLEMGAKGIMVPHIITVEDARNAIDATRFKPLGRRGIDGVNADADWGGMNLRKYLRVSNEEIFLALQIEDVEALSNIEKIAKLRSFEIIFVGIGDLSVSMGNPFDFERNELWNVLENIAKVAKRHRKFLGSVGISPDFTRRLMNLGYQFIMSGADILFLRNSFEKLKDDYRKMGFFFNHLEKNESG